MSDLLQQGIAVFRSGNKEEARKIFVSFIKDNPQSEQGWKWMYSVSRTDRERSYCLEQILRINPGNKKAKQFAAQFSAGSAQGQVSLQAAGARNESKGSIGILTFGAAALSVVLISCFGLALVSAHLAGYDNYTGNRCFSLSLNGKQFCFSSQAAPQAPNSPTLSAPTVNVANKVSSPATPTISVSPTVTFFPSATSTPTIAMTPESSVTSVHSMHLTAPFWRRWPIVPDFSLRAQEILRQARGNSSLDSHTFSKVGDCQMTAGTFLAGYANSKYRLPEGMYETVQWFSESMVSDNMTAVNGYGINTVLDPAFGLSAGYDQCLPNETPLDCELRTRHPMIVLIGMGTNWIPHGEVSFEKHLREIVDKVLATGALPILATKADNVEGNWKLNQVIAQVAYDYDLPLVNVWLSVQDLPNHGLEKPPRQVYLTGDGWMKRNYAWLVTLDKVRQILIK